MTNRERTMAILHYEDADRLPAVHFGYWKELRKEWAQQGKIPKELGELVYDETELDKLIGWDFGWFSHAFWTDTELRPKFETKVLETLADGTQRVQSWQGVIEKIKPGIISIPAEDDYLLKDRAAFETLFKPKMQYSPDRVDLEALKRFNQANTGEYPTCVWSGSIIGKIRDMTSLVGMSYLMYDEDEDLFQEIVDTYAEMQYKCLETVLETGAQFDYGYMWEDICFKNGPLLSPKDFERFCGKHYKKRCDLLRKHGIDLVALDCDGVTDQIQSTWIENGVNVLFPIEVGVWGDQFEKARQRFGSEMRGVGGMDKTAFRKDKAAVDAEIERVKHLVSLGGFIPCPDHRLMPGSKFELVQYYAEEIKKIRL
ncbi:MAG: hypothetical protein IJ315_05985 [Firmicutes bacterium]|nr:hypothetical protein [Bacillota bacterium]